jgi:hypothetical protein
MIFDIPSAKTYYINLNNKLDRNRKTKKVLNDLHFIDYQRYSAKEGKNLIEGCALSHIDLLTNNKNITPFLILEDDIGIGLGYKNKIEVPDDVDAIYLGYSMWGYDLKRAKIFSKMDTPTTIKKITNNLYKISNMLSTHAILYCSKRYCEAAANIMKETLTTQNWHCDYAAALIQKNFNIYAPSSPFFVQNDYWTFKWTSVNLNNFDLLSPTYNEGIKFE